MELKFKSVKSTINESGTITGSFLMSNLLIGQGLTIANALRRVLLSNLEGTSITGIKIPNVVHEFSTIPGIQHQNIFSECRVIIVVPYISVKNTTYQ